MRIHSKKTIEDYKKMEVMELKYYDAEHVTPYTESFEWAQYCPESDVMLMDKDRIVGFMDILPIKKTVFEGIKEGCFNDKYLTTADIARKQDLKAGAHVDLLLSCVVIEEEYRKTDALAMLLLAHLKYFMTFLEEGITIDFVVTSNVTDEGIHFSQKMGFQKVCHSDHGTEIYLIPFCDFKKRILELQTID